MGIGKKIDNYEKSMLKFFSMEYDGLIWCELGCQVSKVGAKRPAKNVYKSLGVNHTSIDINGLHGSLPIDLDNPVPSELLDKFDVVTNYGTIEHVNNQYQVWKNVHDMCKVGGIMIHGLPMEGTWYNHCRYYYSLKLTEVLADRCGYNLYDNKILNFSIGKRKQLLVMATYLKTSESSFLSEKEFKELPLFDTGDTSRTGNYVPTGRRKK